MKIEKTYPPNIDFIKRHLPVDDAKPIFCYGDTIYAPHDDDVKPDLIFHESIHSKQQEGYSSPDIWWASYCLDPHFRLDQEVEAYAEQYNFVKKHTPARIYNRILEECAEILSSPMYKLDITKHQALTLIRKRAQVL